ncbi:hypothetical protein D3C81_2278320 [compost metagenome]
MVARDRKFAAPVAPNRLPDEPLPKADPMSAPLPCCSRTRTMIASADITWTASKSLSIKGITDSGTET